MASWISAVRQDLKRILGTGHTTESLVTIMAALDTIETALENLGIGGGGAGDASKANQQSIMDGADGSAFVAADSLHSLRQLLDSMDALVHSIKNQTDQLPGDPADDSTIAGLLVQLEENIRGTDSDTLKTLSDEIAALDVGGGGGGDATLANQTAVAAVLEAIKDGTTGSFTSNADNLHSLRALLETVRSLVESIRNKTTNLPPDPADQSAVSNALGAVETNIRGADSDTLKTLSDQLDTLGVGIGTETNQKRILDGGAGDFVATTDSLHDIRARVDEVYTKADRLPADPADQGALEAAITAAETNIRGADGDTLESLSDQLDAVASMPAGDATLANQTVQLTNQATIMASVEAVKLDFSSTMTNGIQNHRRGT